MPHASSGSSLYTAREIVDRMLRKLGAFSINEDASADNDAKEGLYQFDLMLMHYSAKRPLWFQLRDELEITLAEDDADYGLIAELNSQLPTGMQFPTEAMIEDTTASPRCRKPIRIVSHKEWAARTDPDRTGSPEYIYIDRLNSPTMHVYPTPDENTDGWKIILTVQTFSPTVRPRNINRDQALTNQPHGLRAAWQLWAVEKLAAICGDGPVRKLPDVTIERWNTQAAIYEADLSGFENREHDTDPPFIQPSVYM